MPTAAMVSQDKRIQSSINACERSKAALLS